MNVTSESIAALAAALAKFQGTVESITKDKKAKIDTKGGGGYSYTYADLGSVLAAIRDPLAKNGLAIIQSPMSTDSRYELVTKVMHADSGEWAQSVMALPVPGNADARALGSAITYARRYALISLLGLATDDDDGNAASEARRRHSERPAPAARNGDAGGYAEAPRGGLSPEKASGLHAALGKFGLKKLEHPVFASAVINREIASFKELTTGEAKRIYEAGEALMAGEIEWRDGAIVAPPDVDEFPPEPDVSLFPDEEAVA